MPALCEAYIEGIETQLTGAFDEWAKHAARAASALAGVLDELLVPEAYRGGSCTRTVSNPSAIVLTPLPLTHFMVCGRTSLCRSRCADAIALFEWERRRVASPVVAPYAFDLTVESPLFNVFDSAHGNQYADVAVLALASLPAVNATADCLARCGAEADCLAAVRGARDADLRVDFFCVPDPHSIQAHVFAAGIDPVPLDETEAMQSTDGLTFTHFDLLWRPGGALPLALGYTRLIRSSVAMDGTTQSEELNELWAWRGNKRVRVVGSDDLAAEALTNAVQRALFGGEILVRPEVGACTIQSALPVQGAKTDELHLYLAFTAQVRGWNGGGAMQLAGHPLRAAVIWRVTTGERLSTRYWPPCAVDCNTAADPTCDQRCDARVDRAIELSMSGTFLMLDALGDPQRLLYLPSALPTATFSASSAYDYAREVRLTGGLGVVSIDRTSAMRLIPSASDALRGSWTRGSVFSMLADALTKPVRDPRVRGQRAWFQANDRAVSQGPWLFEVRLQQKSAGWQLVAYRSQQTHAEAKLHVNCTHLTCSGCATARLRLLCHQAEDCVLSRCIGTVVQTHDVLCGLGSIFEQNSLHAIATWRALFDAMVEMGLLAMRGLSGEVVTHVRLHFPTDQVFGLVCATKDSYAAMVGAGVSLGNQMASLLTPNSGARVGLTAGNFVGALAGQGVLKSTAVAGLVFNVISTATLLPTLAFHRWLLCLANSTTAAAALHSGTTLTLEFGDLGMDASYAACAHTDGLYGLLAHDNLVEATGTAVQQFVQYAVSLLSGLGETVLYAYRLSMDATLDYVLGLVWSLQDILFTFNMRACKVPPFLMQFALQCTCGDQPYRIPSPQRGHGLTDGALWCVGTLSMVLADGSLGYVYNPYSLDQLSGGLAGVTAYIACLSTSASPVTQCKPPAGEAAALPLLLKQGVDPIAVWARCKSNYAQSAWDVGAGRLFSPPSLDEEDPVPTQARVAAITWASGLSVDLLECLRDPTRLRSDYGPCQTLFFSLVRRQTPSAYYLYATASDTAAEPPDACRVFSGLAAASREGSALKTLMRACELQEDPNHVAACDLNPLVRSAATPQKSAVAAIHGTTPPEALASREQQAARLYADSEAKLTAAYTRFVRDFSTSSSSTEEGDSKRIETMLFSADGDALHQYFDCLFLGPYTRVDLRACDAEGVLDCPFYARDEAGGLSRAFTPCFGDKVMHGDHALPYTCGSAARRSVIKYFYRNYSKALRGGMLAQNLTSLVRTTIDALYRNYTQPYSRGCMDPDTGTCRLEACALMVNGYAPCMTTEYQLPSTLMERTVVEQAFTLELPAYYHWTRVSTLPWTAYDATGSVRWGTEARTAAAAAALSQFDTARPLLSYSAQEAFTMPTPAEAKADPVVTDALHSQWGVCAALMGQLAMTLPIDAATSKPMGATTPTASLEALIQNLTQRAMASASPFVWHRDRRHAPSRSRVCRSSLSSTPGQAQTQRRAPGRLRLVAGQMHLPNEKTLVLQEDRSEHLPHFGFLSQAIGDAHTACVCAVDRQDDPSRCVVDALTCEPHANTTTTTPNHNKNNRTGCALLDAACATATRTYMREDAPALRACLRKTPGVRCPELGPSDLVWGLYPAGATRSESALASDWVGDGANDVRFETTRFLHEPRSGVRLSNYRTLNATYHTQGVDYAAMTDEDASSLALERCFEAKDLAPTDDDDEDVDWSEDVLRTLFPAAQLLSDAPLSGVCMRYVIETARAAVLANTSSGRNAALQAAAWRRRCGALVREAAACMWTDALFVTPTPDIATKAALQQQHCGLTIAPPAFLTPMGCVAIDPRTRRMYDARLCAHMAHTVNAPPLIDACLLSPQPLSLIAGDAPYPMLFTEGGVRLAADWLLNLDAPTLDGVRHASDARGRDQVSHVLDWWDRNDSPVGLHVTASVLDASEFAPLLFDSHYLYDPDERTIFYAHSVARNRSLMHDMLGAAGVCRAPNVGMPLFDANTNRMCTRLSRNVDTPTMPAEQTKSSGHDESWPYTEAYMDRHFLPERCALSHDEVPWAGAADAWSAGDLPGWRAHAELDVSGGTTYPYTAFPPPDYAFASLPRFEAWSDACVVPWRATRTCEGVDCPAPATVCIEGLCVSAATFNREPGRAPCFATRHCGDGLVCLADGACAPLTMHAWNRATHDWDMEVALLADACGLVDEAEDAQTTRGASPWETVPDLLHMHGLCGHREWFAYRSALWQEVCPIRDAPVDPSYVGHVGEGGYAECNTTSVAWPWVQQRYDGVAATKRPPQTLEEGRALLAVPHACDQVHMHLQAPTTRQRMRVCSGGRGVPMAQYPLHPKRHDWAGVAMPPDLVSGAVGVSEWMRTYDPSTGALHVGVLNHRLTADVPLGFLGADLAADADVRAEMATRDVNFFRCIQRMNCTNPSFTYNGVRVQRLDPVSLTAANFSEINLRLCGAIGYVALNGGWPGRKACWLDVALFPLLGLLVWPVTADRPEGVTALFQLPSWVVREASPSLAMLQASRQKLFCDPDAKRCAFAARESDRLPTYNDDVIALSRALNALPQSAGAAVRVYAAAHGETRAYEQINHAAVQLVEWTATHQIDLQQAYGTLGTSGVYVALRLVLFEVPIAWLHHAMLVTLLSGVDPTVPAPALEALGLDASLSVFLWSKADRAVVCHDEAALDARPVLWRLICNNVHVEQPPNTNNKARDADAWVSALRARTLLAIQRDLPNYALSTVSVTCTTGLEWNCGNAESDDEGQRCMEAIALAYNDRVVEDVQATTACQAAVREGKNEWLRVCENSERFRAAGTPVSMRLADLEARAPTRGGLDKYIQGLRQTALRVVDAAILPVDYIEAQAWSDVSPASADKTRLPFARVWSIADFMTAFVDAQNGFNLTHWLRSEVCTHTVPDPEAVLCANQYATSSNDPCIWSSGAPYSDRMQHWTPNGLNVVLHYGGDGGTTSIPICQLVEAAGPNGLCVVRRRGEHSAFTSVSSSDDSNTEGAHLPCDITRIVAPPGVEVQGFALRLTTEQWLARLPEWPEEGDAPWVFPDAFCTEVGATPADGSAPFASLDEIRSCTWTTTAEGEAPQTSAWWHGNVSVRRSARPDLDGLRPMDGAYFSQMHDWWEAEGLGVEWKNSGCAQDQGLCAVRLRLKPTVKAESATVCAPPMPSCAFLTESNAIHPFVVGSDRMPPQSAMLVRCAPCTRYRKRLALPPDALVRCALSTGSNDETGDVLAAIVRSTAFLSPLRDVDVRLHPMANNGTTAQDVLATLTPLGLGLEHWDKRAAEAHSASCNDDPASCFAGMAGLHFLAMEDQRLWDAAVQHADLEFTMLCQNQIYSEDQALRCDPLTDAPRRRLADFVQRRYREANGVWMPTVSPGTGLAWTARVASNTTGLFSLMYASTKRPARDVQTRWLLGDGPCTDVTSIMQNRICVESTTRSQLPFQALHPWIGGDFNPFDGFDQCVSHGTRTALCACACTPDTTCAPSEHAYSPSQMALEFPFDARCNSQAFASTHTMDENDPSNLCAHARAAPRAAAYVTQCLHTQGLLGDPSLARTVTAEELHSPTGVNTRLEDFLIQDLYGVDGRGNGLWAGRTLQQERVTGLERYAFLRIDRARPQPAHIAFTTADDAYTGAPLVVAGLSLLRGGTASMSSRPIDWVPRLLQKDPQDIAWLAELYPQLATPRLDVWADDWTCPLRVVAFWGGASDVFAPVVPAPILAQALYGMGGAHPLIRSRRARDALRPYVTTNGACYYLADAPPIAIDVDTDATNPCGLHGMVRLLMSGAYAPSIILTPDSAAETVLLDTPDLGATLRSGETLPGGSPRVGALQRVSPFLMRTRGDAGTIRRSATLTTRSEGGDCHMGRALLGSSATQDRAHLAGAACALVSKNETTAIAECDAEKRVLVLARARPLSLRALLDKKTRMYRDDPNVVTDVPFLGPGGTLLADAESSFGLLYATPLARALASDLRRQQPALLGEAAAWRGRAFWRFYSTGNGDALLLPRPSVSSSSSSTTTSETISVERRQAEEARAQAAAEDAALWARTNWTWRPSPNLSDSSVGNVNRTRWMQADQRVAACADSYRTFVGSDAHPHMRTMPPLALCEPALTPSLQAFCTALLQYRTEITTINCEVVGDCLYAPAAFYVPYAWSATNQQFVSDTVVAYYQSILQQPRFAAANESYRKLCPLGAASNWMTVLGKLSNDQAAQCPAFQLEGIKRLIETLRLVIYDVIYMGYCLLMFGLNALGAAASTDVATGDSAMQMTSYYLTEFLLTAEKIIMPILNALVSTLFGTSTLGKIMSVALNVLCETYNLVIKRFFIPIWCAIIRPALYVIFDTLATLVGVVSSKAAGEIRAVWTALSGGDSGPNPATCLGSLAKTIDCSAGINKAPNANLTQYLAAPIATRCWADSSAQMRMAGAGPLGGMGDAAFLTCTGSDTCAPDPLHFDATVGTLIACAACPMSQFGCDPALKRCTCGTNARTPDACLASDDCLTRQCAVVSDLDNVADATTNLPCAECGSLGMQVACVRSANGVGTCACASVAAAGTLQTCAERGRAVSLLRATGFCLSTPDLSTNLLSPSLVLEFGTLAITPCLLGLSSNGCVGVRLPFSSSAGAYIRAFAVLLAPAPPASAYASSRRRLLLSLSSDTNNEAACANASEPRACAMWRLAAREVADALPETNKNRTSDAEAWALVAAHPLGATRRLLRYADGLAPLALATLLDAIDQPSQPPPPPPPPPLRPKKHGRRLHEATPEIEWPFMYLAPTLMGQSDNTCAVIDDAIVAIADAWADTLRFYADPARYETEPPVEVTTPMEDWVNTTLNTPLPSGWISVGNQNAGFLGNLAEAVTLGYGRRLVDAVVSDARGRSMWSDMATCNFTALTLGTRTSVHRARGMTLLYLIAATGLVCVFLTAFVLPSALSRVVWYVLFPAAVFWAAYGVSPLCWPMIPPRFPHDVVVDLSQLLPFGANTTSGWTLPAYLVHEDCDLYGRRMLLPSLDANEGESGSVGPYDPTCFRACDAEPFLFKSWQDTAAWWLCDFSVGACAYAGGLAARWSPLSDFASSAAYFGDAVLRQPELAAAFRTCAAFTSFYLIFSAAVALFVLAALPAVLAVLIELVSATLVLLAQTLAGNAVLSTP